MRIEDIITERYSTEDLKYMFKFFNASSVVLLDCTVKEYWDRIDRENKRICLTFNDNMINL